MTRQPRKQRKQRYDASLHERHKHLRAPLTEELRDEYETRNTRVNTGDTVEVLRGDHAGFEDDVVEVDLRDGSLKIEGVTVEKSDGEEVLRPVDASNVRITALDLSDTRRENRLRGEDA